MSPHDDPSETWEPRDPIPAGYEVRDGDAESGPCYPYLVPIETCLCETCETEQRVIQRITVNPADPTTAYRLKCGHTVI